jgi:hypothetical protein
MWQQRRPHMPRMQQHARPFAPHAKQFKHPKQFKHNGKKMQTRKHDVEIRKFHPFKGDRSERQNVKKFRPQPQDKKTAKPEGDKLRLRIQELEERIHMLQKELENMRGK